MTKATPSIASKSKWVEKTVGAIRIDIDRHEGMPVGYAMAFFDPFTTNPDKMWSFAIRLGHSKEYLDEDQKERLEVALRYIMMGVQKIMNVDKEQVDRWMQEYEDDFDNYIAKGKLQ